MSGVNRKLRRAAAKKAFRSDAKMSDVDKELAQRAGEETVNKMLAGLSRMLVRAFCLTEMVHFKDINKKETRIQNSIKLAYEYTHRISEKQLSKEEYDLLVEIDKKLDKFLMALAKGEENGQKTFTD